MPPRNAAPARPLARYRLENGLRVIVDPDPGNPLVGVAVAYDVGFRSEPEERTGFAHLFEHMMFQGSANVAKVEHMRLVEGAGGVFNGHTLADLTAYYEALPTGALELSLWLEADRMRSLAVTEENLRNQVAVVEEEIKVNVLNQPYGGFPFIVLPELAFDSFPNSHNGYGAFADLERASLEDVADFYANYYRPNNAVLAVTGGCEPEEVARLAETYFGDIEAGRPLRHGPWPEPPLRAARMRVVDDEKAPQPAFVAGYRTPDPGRELDSYLAYVVLARVLAGGDASRLRSRMVHGDRTVVDVSCRLGIFGEDAFFMRDPVLFQVIVVHPGAESDETLLRTIGEEVARLATDGPAEGELERVAAVTTSGYWRGLDSVMERAVSLASIESVHGRAELIAEIPQLVAAVSRDAVAAAAADISSQHPAVVRIRPAGRARGRS